MKISYDWLTQYIKTDAHVETISEVLTEIGLEVEGVKDLSNVGNLEGVIVAEVQEVRPHPNADRLKVCKVFDGKNTYQVVCGASNVKDNQKVALATIGTTLTMPDGNSLKIKKSKLRGEVSEGMLCAEDELGISSNHHGIMVLDEYAALGIPLKEYLDTDDDYQIEIGLTPNRADAMSHYGVARDLHAGLKMRNIASTFLPLRNEFLLDNKEEPTYKVVLENEDCKRYCLAHLTDIEVKDSPEWLQKKLRSIDLEPINNVVDITNYVLHSYGQPLHAFDAQQVKGNTIVVGNNEEGREFITLDDKKRKLHYEDLMIKNGENEPMCIAGVFGGKNSGVTKNTSEIVLESAYFEPVSVRKSAKRHALNTDASFRFERGIDPKLTLLALKKATELLVEIANAQINESFIDLNHLGDLDHEVRLRFERANTIIGNPIPKEKIKEIFDVLDIEVIEENEEGMKVKVPAFRTDVTREIDLIEEILRIYGYNKVEVSDKVSFSLKTETDFNLATENSISDLLSSNGYFEVMNNSLTRSKGLEDEVELLNPLSQDLAVMRTSMLDGILGNLQFNINRSESDLKFFEWGKIYFKKENEYKEYQKLALSLTGKYWQESWSMATTPSTFFQLKGIVHMLFEKLGVSYAENEITSEEFSEGLTFTIGKTELGTLGKVNKAILKKMGIKQEVWYAELNWENVKKHRKPESFKLKALPKFPGSRRDLALLLDKEVQYKDLKSSAFQVNKSLLKSINLFDVYEGKNLPDGKKSYALSYQFLDEEKTIEDQQVDTIIDAIIKKYQKEFNAELRA